MSDRKLDLQLRTLSFVCHSPEGFIDVKALDYFAVGISSISSMLVVFPAEIQTVVSFRAKFGGSKFNTLTYLFKNALSSDIGVFLRHISSNKLQKRFPI
eukprot:4836776-Ditylum_brightwellii.AAC.1